MVQLQVLKLLKQMQFDMKNLTQTHIPVAPVNTRNFAPSNTRRTFSKTPNAQTQSPRSRRPNCCWTHRASLHSGNECTRRAQGHEEDTTLANRMGVSNECCA